MKKLLSLLLVLPIAFMTSCSSDDDSSGGGAPFVGATKTYQLGSVAVPTISGTAKFIENENGSTTIELQLVGTPSGGMHPAHIHLNTAAEGGDIALTLGTVDGDTGFSTITTSTLNDDSAITYDELINYDGYINVHFSAGDLGTIVAQGDIGQNELTGNSTSYDLATLDVPGISGTVNFEERANGEALATIALVGTPVNGVHPAHIHMGSVATAPGGILFTFTPVDGTTGMSATNVAALDDDTAFGYSDVLAVDGYVNVHLSADALGTIVAQGNIGAN